MIWFMSTLTQHPTLQLPKLPIKLHHQTTFFANMYIQMFSSCRTFIDCSFVKIQGRSTLHFVWLIHPCFCQFSWRSMNLVHFFLLTCFLLGAVASLAKIKQYFISWFGHRYSLPLTQWNFCSKYCLVVVVSENRSSKCSVLSKAND